MLAILYSLNAHDVPIFQPILLKLISKFIIYRAHSDKAYLSLGLLSPLTLKRHLEFAADDNFKFCCFFKNNKSGMIFHENRLLADDSHEISYPFFFEN